MTKWFLYRLLLGPIVMHLYNKKQGDLYFYAEMALVSFNVFGS